MFHEGLQPTIKAEMAVEDFENLQSLMDIAMVTKARNVAWQEEGNHLGGRRHDAAGRLGWGISRASNWARPNTHSSVPELSNSTIKAETTTELRPSLSTISSGSKPTSRWISNEEWTDRQRKGLCFRCGDKWNPHHSCKFRHQQLVILVEDEKTLDVLEDIPDNEQPLLALHRVSLHLSSFSYWGLTSHKTLKFRGTINGSEVIILVDLGAKANFLSTTLVSTLGLPLVHLPPFRVEVGNGNVEHGLRGCERVTVLVQGISIVEDFLVMELGRFEVVLDAG